MTGNELREIQPALNAMKRTLALAIDRNIPTTPDLPEIDSPHLLDMYARAQGFNDPAKINRWLGWMQAAVYVASKGEISLEDLAELNRDAFNTSQGER